MAFWDKLLGKKKDFYEIPVSERKADFVQAPQETEKKDLECFFSLSGEEEQERIKNFIRPVTDMNQVINLQISYGVRTKDMGIFMVRYRTEQEKLANTNEYLYTTHFIVLQDEDCFEVSYAGNDSRDAGDLTFSIPKGNEEILKQAMDFYRNWELHKVFDREQKDLGIDTFSLNNEIRKPLFKECEAYANELKNQQLAKRKTIEIHSEEEAKELFFQSYFTLKEEYTEETIQAFEKYATYEKRKEWVLEECRQILKNIADGDCENAYDGLEKVNGRCGYFLGSDSELLAEDYTKACKTLFSCGEERFVVSVPSFLAFLKNSENPFAARELLEITEKYFLEKASAAALEEDAHWRKFKNICAELRGKMRELSTAENGEGFEFVLMPEEYLRKIVLWYRNKYNDDDAVKESVAELNCAYGVKNSKAFITGLNEAADSRHYAACEFVAVLLETGEIIEFSCRREAVDGSFVTGCGDCLVKEQWRVLESGIEYYRNRAAREDFFEAYRREHENESIGDLMEKSHKRLLSKYKRHYEKEFKLARSNPLSKTLLKLVDICEQKGPVYGYKNIKFNKPATAEEIAAWERDHDLLLPATYKQFLFFADGVCVLRADAIYGLGDLRVNDDYLEPDYILMGQIIGDGTTICMSAATGNIYLEDHGEYKDKGTFAEFLIWFTDFLEGF